MDKVLLFGATGNLGREIAGELKKQDYGITAVARSEALAKSLAGTVDEYVIADVMRAGSLRGVCDGRPSQVNPGKKVRRVPLGLVRALLPLTRAFDRNTYDKFAFYIQVMAEDTIAPQVGQTRFEDYIRMKAGK